jgi:hypothetical protein
LSQTPQFPADEGDQCVQRLLPPFPSGKKSRYFFRGGHGFSRLVVRENIRAISPSQEVRSIDDPAAIEIFEPIFLLFSRFGTESNQLKGGTHEDQNDRQVRPGWYQSQRNNAARL